MEQKSTEVERALVAAQENERGAECTAKVEQEEDSAQKTAKTAFMEGVAALLHNPTDKTLGYMKKKMQEMVAKKEKGSARLQILVLAKVFYTLLPTYNIHTKGYKYSTVAKANNYEYMLVQEWQAYLRVVTRSKTEESYEAAAILLPQTVLFNKSVKLIGKVVRGTEMAGKTGEKCRRVLKKMFACDKGNRIVKVLEVVNQMAIKRVPRCVLKMLQYISDEVLKKPEVKEKMIVQEMRKLTVEEKAVQKETELRSLPAEIKAWKGINERLLRIYLLVITEREVEKHAYALKEMQRLRVPGNLHEGVYTVLTEKIAEMRAKIKKIEEGTQRDRRRVGKMIGVLFACYETLNKVFGHKLELSGQMEEIEQIPLCLLVEADDADIASMYAALRSVEKHKGTCEVVKKLIQRGMLRIDTKLASVVQQIVPRDGPAAIEKMCEDGFWEYALIRRRSRHV